MKGIKLGYIYGGSGINGGWGSIQTILIMGVEVKFFICKWHVFKLLL